MRGRIAAIRGLQHLGDDPGVYRFLCSFPGHFVTMRGVMIVERARDEK